MHSAPRGFNRQCHGEQGGEVVGFGKPNPGFLKSRLEILFSALLAMKPDRVKTAGLTRPPQQQHGVVTGFGLLHPLPGLSGYAG